MYTTIRSEGDPKFSGFVLSTSGTDSRVPVQPKSQRAKEPQSLVFGLCGLRRQTELRITTESRMLQSKRNQFIVGVAAFLVVSQIFILQYVDFSQVSSVADSSNVDNRPGLDLHEDLPSFFNKTEPCYDRFSWAGGTSDHPLVLYNNKIIPREGISTFPNRTEPLDANSICSGPPDPPTQYRPGVEHVSRCEGISECTGKVATYGTLMREFVKLGIHTKAECCRHAAPSITDVVNRLFEPFLEIPPPPFEVTDRPFPLEDILDCTRPDLSHVLTGKIASKRRKVIDAWPAAHELDMAEARLFELDGVADAVFIAESRYSFRGSRKTLHFSRAKERFERFPIVLGSVDDCQPYLDDVLVARYMNADRPSTIWDVQSKHRACLSKWVLEQTSDKKEWPDDTLVLYSDLDEIPNGEVAYHLSMCEIRQEAWPLRILTTSVGSSARHLTTVPEFKQNVAMNVQLLGDSREAGMIRLRSVHDKYQAAGKKSTEMAGGAHLSSWGTQVHRDYKPINHGEGGQLSNTGVKDDIDIAHMTETDWCNRAEALQWLKAAVIEAEYDPAKHKVGSLPSKCLMYKAGIPWIIIENPQRYPSFMGVGKYDDVTVPWELWEEAVKANGFDDRYGPDPKAVEGNKN